MELLACTVFSHCLYFFFFGKLLFSGVCLISIYFVLDYWSNSREKFCICLFLGLKSSSGLWSAFVLPFLWMKMLHFLVMLESMVNQVNFTLWPPHPTPRHDAGSMLPSWWLEKRSVVAQAWWQPLQPPILLATGASAFCSSPFAPKASASQCFMRVHQYPWVELNLKAYAWPLWPWLTSCFVLVQLYI